MREGDFQQVITQTEPPSEETLMAELAAKQQKARADFDAQLAAERQKALDKYQGQIPSQIEAALLQKEQEARVKFEADLAEKEWALREGFQIELAAQRQTALGVWQARKRVEVARLGAPYDPRALATEREKYLGSLESWETGQETAFQTSLSNQILSAKSTFESGLETWRQTEKERLKQEAETSFTAGLSEWETKQRAAFETQLSTWSTETLSSIQSYVAEVKATDVKLKDWKTSLPKDYTVEKINGEWVAYPSGYMPPEKQPDGTYVSKPVPKGYNYDPKTKQLIPYTVAVPITESDILTVAAVVFPFIAPALLPESLGITTAKLATGALLNLGLSEAASYIMTGQPLPIEQVPLALVLGEVSPVVMAGTVAAVGTVSPQIVSSLLGRTAIQAGIGAGYSYVLSGFKPEEALKGAVFGAAFSLGWELIGQPAIAQAKLKLGLAKPLYAGEPTVGKLGEDVGTWISEPVEALGGKRIRVVSGVTELPVGTEGVTRESLIAEYLGKDVATAHATLAPKYFKLGAGEVTELVGIPSQATGWRAYQEWYHFYSAPSLQDEYITIYGGYMGVGEGYSGETPRVIIGGKPTALMTTKTYITPEMLPVAGEGIDDYLARVSTTMGGLTGIDPAVTLGVVGERQVITPASYIRKGEPTFGSLFISEGKAGQFIIQDLPEGLLGKIPVLRTMFSQYTTLDVLVGSFAPAPSPVTGKPVSLAMTGLGESVISVPSVPSALLSFAPSPISVSHPSRLSVSSLAVSAPSIPIFSAPSKPVTHKPSKPSVPSKPVSVASYVFSSPSKPSLPSLPSYPSAPSYPSTSVGSIIFSAPSRRVEEKAGLKKRVKPRYSLFDYFVQWHWFPYNKGEIENYVFGKMGRAKRKQTKSSRRHKK
jgi:hypothetical protein